MSAKRIAEIKARADAATPPPWKHAGGRQVYCKPNGDYVPARTTEDAAFIAAVREDVPWLLAQLAEARSAARMLLDGEVHGLEWQEWNERLKAWE